MKKLMMAVAAMAAWCAMGAVPTQSEFTAAGQVIADLLEPEMTALKSGKKNPAEVADYAMSLVGESDTAAAKFLLALRAYGLYMKGGAYDKAVEAIGGMREAVPDMPNERMLKAIQPAAQSVSEKKAPGVCAVIADLRGKVRSQNEIVKLESALIKAKVSERPSISRQLGECYAVMGDWKNALEHFAKSGGDIATMAKAEAEGSLDIAKSAGFWWDYSENSSAKKSVASAVRQHAVELYKKGLADGTISGLNKKLAEQRIEVSNRYDGVKVHNEVLYESRLTYIESTGKQWIDTGIVPNGQTKVELIDFQAIRWTCDWCEFLGSGSKDMAEDYFGFRRIWLNDMVGFKMGNPTGKNYSASEFLKFSNYNADLKLNTKCNSIVMSNNGIASKQLKPRLVNPNINKSINGKNTLFLFACNMNGRPFRPSAIRLGRVKIWQGTRLVSDIIPVLQDGEPCMFDSVSKRILPRQGDEKFIAGNKR